jgi:hypothetical protein
MRAQLVAQLGTGGAPPPGAPRAKRPSGLIPAYRPGDDQGSGGGAAGDGAPAHDAAPAGGTAAGTLPPAPRLWRAAMDGLVADHLAARGLGCALSVFAAEAGLPDAGPSLGPADVLALLRLPERHPAAAGALAGLPRAEGAARAGGGGAGRACGAARRVAAGGHRPTATPPLPTRTLHHPALPPAPQAAWASSYWRRSRRRSARRPPPRTPRARTSRSSWRRAGARQAPPRAGTRRGR